MRFWAALCVALLWLTARAPAARAEQPVMRLFTTEDGLVRKLVNQIRRDSKGRLWFCTVEGLSVFDGERFSNYTTSQGLPHQMVNDIVEAGDGTYLLATWAGLFRFRPHTAAGPASFVRIPLQDGVADRSVDVLLRTRPGEIWCGTRAGIYRIRKGGSRGEAVALTGEPGGNGFPMNVHGLAEDSTGALWVASDAAVYRRMMDGRVFSWSATQAPVPAWAVLAGRDGMIWVGGMGGLARLDIRSDPPAVTRYRFGHRHPLGEVRSLLLGQDGELWIGGFGLARLHTKEVNPARQFEYFDRASPLGSQYPYAIEEDGAGNIWLALRDLGAARLLRPGFGQFSELDGLESKSVLGFVDGVDGALYAVSGVRHTLNRFDGRRFLQVHWKTPPSVKGFGWGEHSVVIQDHLGEWWVATDSGLLRYPRVARIQDLEHSVPRAVYRKPRDIQDNRVVGVAEDPAGDIWIALPAGLARWRRATGRFEDLTAEAHALLGEDPTPLAFASDRAGNLWIGLYLRGLLRFSHGRLEKVLDDPSAASVGAIRFDAQGRLWIATTRGGAGRCDKPLDARPGFRFYNRSTGLRSDQIFDVAVDADGRVYLAGSQGVDRLDPATGAVQYFLASGGLPMGETQRLHRDRQGAIWFASNFGLSRYLPSPDPPGPPPDPSIREVRISGLPVMSSDEGERLVERLEVPARKGSLEIAYGSVDFAASNRVGYRHRLLPVESAWSAATNSRSVQYAGLGPNRYRFEVQSVTSSGVPGAAIAAVGFEVEAPLWQRPWLLLLVGATAAGLVYAALLYRWRHQLALELVRSHLAADLHDDLGSGLVEIAILAEVAKERGCTTDLDVVAGRARELRATMSDIVWSVNPAGDNLEEWIRRCRQTAYALLGDDNLEFVAPADSESSKVALAPDQRRNLLLFFKECLTNVVRHAQAKKVGVLVALEGAALRLEIRDDGRGFTPKPLTAGQAAVSTEEKLGGAPRESAAQRVPGEPLTAGQADGASSGQGLRSMAQRAEALDGSMSIESQPGAGTVVRLRVPIRHRRMNMRLFLPPPVA